LTEQLLARKPSFVSRFLDQEELRSHGSNFQQGQHFIVQIQQSFMFLGINKYFKSAKSGAMFLSLGDKIAVNVFEGLM
jgi:hypothetical protein